MSVMITIKLPSAIEASTAEKVARGEQADRLKAIMEDCQAQGCLHHMFTEDADGGLFVVDEWPDEGSWRRFVENQPEMAKVAEAMGGDANVQPEVTVRRILDTPDRF
jgi:hypothetical protein